MQIIQSHFFIPIAGSFSFSAAAAVAETVSSSDVTAAAAARLASLGQCPTTPKPTCEGKICLGSRWVCETQYQCGRERPVPDPASGHCSIILAGCRCSREAIHIACNNGDCRASEQLQNCPCETWEDRRETIRDEMAKYSWLVSTNDVEDLIDECFDSPPYGESINITSTTFTPPSNSMHSVQPAPILPAHRAGCLFP